MESKYFHVILMGSDKNSSRYGKPIRVECYDEAKVSKETIEQKIAEWKDVETLPVIIQNPLIIELFNFLRGRKESQESELYDIKESIRRIAEQLEQLAW